MAKGKQAGSNKAPGKLEDLKIWNKRPFLDKMLDDGVTPYKCTQWCKENGFELSKTAMYTYVKQRNHEALKVNLIREELVNDLHAELITPSAVKAGSKNKSQAKPPVKTSNAAEYKDTLITKIKNDMELLDEIIQKGFQTMAKMEAINPATAIKAIELKNKITGGAHIGLTTYGMEEIRHREAAREQAIIEVLMSFIDETKHDDVIDLMERVTMEYYESIGLGDAYIKMQEREGAVNG